eukprot:561420-Amphidinium_carterae.1
MKIGSRLYVAAMVLPGLHTCEEFRIDQTIQTRYNVHDQSALVVGEIQEKMTPGLAQVPPGGHIDLSTDSYNSHTNPRHWKYRIRISPLAHVPREESPASRMIRRARMPSPLAHVPRERQCNHHQ